MGYSVYPKNYTPSILSTQIILYNPMYTFGKLLGIIGFFIDTLGAGNSNDQIADQPFGATFM